MSDLVKLVWQQVMQQAVNNNYILIIITEFKSIILDTFDTFIWITFMFNAFMNPDISVGKQMFVYQVKC